MKRLISFFLCLILAFSTLSVEISAVDDEFTPVVLEFSLTADDVAGASTDENVRASGLITSYGLNLSKSGTKLLITGQTYAATGVVKCGFKDLTIQRRKSSAYSWEDYYEYGNVYREATAANLDTTLSVASGYQYRISCKHYAKKSLLVTQSISNTSGIVTVS